MLKIRKNTFQRYEEDELENFVNQLQPKLLVTINTQYSEMTREPFFTVWYWEDRD